ncbi:MAG: 2Fe-2S iron-sulfur cluster binding domain-containing protein [Flexilinea sp.]|nr:2Fe-2S iron-sulfur cluster binding domain-containing protein [Flexilinea sp.]
MQYGIVSKVIERGENVKSFVLVPDPERGTSGFDPFRAGQYISITQRIGKAVVCKSYSVCADPADALDPNHSSYTVMLERNPAGFFSPQALDHWKPGTRLLISEPRSDPTWGNLNAVKHVVALAGGSGITPFFALAGAVADGLENYDLTILYGNDRYDRILLREELEEFVRRSNGKIRMVHVLSGEKRNGCEFGFITADLVKKYAPDGDYSILICGPKPMYDFLYTELPRLGLPEDRICFGVPGEFGDPASDPSYPHDAAEKVWTIKVRRGIEEQSVPCRSDQTLMQAVERAGIFIDAGCRSGVCGWCECGLLSGAVFVPESRKQEDIETTGRIHPCVSYPLSDVAIELPDISGIDLGFIG